MAKNNKKSQSRRQRKNNPGSVAAATPPSPSSKPDKVASLRRGDFNPDYDHIKRDLRRIAGLSLFFVSLLVALSLYLN